MISGLESSFHPAFRQPVITRLHQEIQKVLQTADIKDRLTKLGVEPMPMSSDQFQAYLGKEIKTNETLVKAAKISAQ